jgi:hypothetical protein
MSNEDKRLLWAAAHSYLRSPLSWLNFTLTGCLTCREREFVQVVNRVRPNLLPVGSKIFAGQNPMLFFSRSLGRDHWLLLKFEPIRQHREAARIGYN